MNEAVKEEVVVPELSQLLSTVWHNVVIVVNKMLETHQKYGYVKFQERMNPTLPELVEGFKHVDTALTSLMETGSLTYDEYRDAINSKQCILKMKLLSVALEAKEQDDYERIISDLKAQAQL